MWDPYTAFESATLPNGLEVYAAHWPGRTWQHIGFLIHSGAKQDFVGLEGTAHFVEHLVSQNTSVSQGGMVDFFSECGGNVCLGETRLLDTQYRFFAPIDRGTFKQACSMFGDMLFSSQLEDFIERERSVIIEEFYRRYVVDFAYEWKRHVRTAAYAGLWPGRFVSPMGHPESIKSITQSDLQVYYDTHYTPVNMSVVSVGGLCLSDLIDLFSDSSLSVVKEGVRTPFSVPIAEPPLPEESRRVFNPADHGILSVARAGYESFASIPGTSLEWAVIIARNVLDRILFRRIREELGATYDIGSSYTDYGDFYQFVMRCYSFSPEIVDDLEGIIDSCVEHCLETFSDGSGGDILDYLKSKLVAKTSLFDIDGESLCEDVLHELSLKRRIISLAEEVKAIEAVTIDDVRDVFSWIQKERRFTVLRLPS